MLSRVADSLYWLGRYLERADFVARQLDVHLTVAPEQALEAAGRRRNRLIACLVGESYPAEGVQSDYDLAQLLTFDADNPNAIAVCIAAARENARQVREQINSQMWEQLNQLYLAVQEASLAELWSGQPHRFYHGINQDTYRFQGITDSRMSRDQGWHFIQLGRYLERAIATAEVLDVEFRDLYRGGGLRTGAADQQSYLEWVALLRGCAAYEAYTRVYTLEVEPRHIAEFLLLNPEFPYSVHFAIDVLQGSLEAIAAVTETSKGARVHRLVGRLRATVDYGQIDEIMDAGLGSYLLDIRRACGEIHNAIYQTYITYPIEEKLAA